MTRQAINLTLTVEETNLVLEALGALSYAQVYQLIGSIHQQAEAALDGGVHAVDPVATGDTIRRPA